MQLNETLVGPYSQTHQISRNIPGSSKDEFLSSCGCFLFVILSLISWKYSWKPMLYIWESLQTGVPRLQNVCEYGLYTLSSSPSNQVLSYLFFMHHLQSHYSPASTWFSFPCSFLSFNFCKIVQYQRKTSVCNFNASCYRGIHFLWSFIDISGG